MTSIREQNYRKTLKTIGMGFAIVAPIALGLEFLTDVHAQFILDGTRFFYAWYGFVACLAMVLVAKILGFILTRNAGYYKDSGDE